MTVTSGPEPTAQGSLGKTPLVNLLVYMADRAYSGSLVFTEPNQGPGEEHTVYFFEGTPAKFRTGKPVAYLGRVLFDLGLLSEQVLNDSLLAISRRAELHGEYLVRTGAINHDTLMQGLRAQSQRKMAFVFGLPHDTAFSFYQDTNLLGSWGGPELTLLEPLPTIWSGIRSASNDPVVDLLLRRLGATTLKLHEESDAARFGFSPDELAVVDLLRERPCPLSGLIETGVVAKRTIELIVYALVVTRHIDHGDSTALPVGAQGITDASHLRAASVPVARVKLARAADSANSGEAEKSSGSSSSPTADRQRAVPGSPVFGSSTSGTRPMPAGPSASPAPAASGAPAGAPRVPSASPSSPLSPALAARRDAILKRAEGIDRENYYQMLGLPREAEETQIQAAYYALAKIWHPDRLPHELLFLRDEVSKVFARVNEAFDTLTNPVKRHRYAEILKGGGGTPEEAQKIQQILDAANDFQRAEILWKKKDPKAAEYIMRAYQAEPDQPDYMALYATMLLSKRSPDAPVDDLIKLCDRAIEAQERCAPAFFCRALLRKRIGKLEAAMSDFRAAYEINPKNLDAAREVRLHEMRRSKTDKRSQPGQRRNSVPGTKPTLSGRPSNSPTKTPLPGAKKEGGVLSGIGKLFKR